MDTSASYNSEGRPKVDLKGRAGRQTARLRPPDSAQSRAEERKRVRVRYSRIERERHRLRRTGHEWTRRPGGPAGQSPRSPISLQ